MRSKSGRLIVEGNDSEPDDLCLLRNVLLGRSLPTDLCRPVVAFVNVSILLVKKNNHICIYRWHSVAQQLLGVCYSLRAVERGDTY